MSTATATRPVAAGPGSAGANRAAKARAIASWAWHHGITSVDLAALLDARDSARQRRIALAAGETRNPSLLTWQAAVKVLDTKEAHAAEHPRHPRSVREAPGDRWEYLPADLAGPRADVEPLLHPPGWEPDDAEPVDPEAAGRVLSYLHDLDQALDADLPKGWAELAARPPLPAGECIHHPDRRPVVMTMDGGRCGACPPRRAEIKVTVYEAPAPGVRWDSAQARVTGTALRDGWGMKLDWTPKS